MYCISDNNYAEVLGFIKEAKEEAQTKMGYMLIRLIELYMLECRKGIFYVQNIDRKSRQGDIRMTKARIDMEKGIADTIIEKDLIAKCLMLFVSPDLKQEAEEIQGSTINIFTREPLFNITVVDTLLDGSWFLVECKTAQHTKKEPNE